MYGKEADFFVALQSSGIVISILDSWLQCPCGLGSSLKVCWMRLSRLYRIGNILSLIKELLGFLYVMTKQNEGNSMHSLPLKGDILLRRTHPDATSKTAHLKKQA